MKTVPDLEENPCSRLHINNLEFKPFRHNWNLFFCKWLGDLKMSYFDLKYKFDLLRDHMESGSEMLYGLKGYFDSFDRISLGYASEL
jgi:hypothetical protein